MAKNASTPFDSPALTAGVSSKKPYTPKRSLFKPFDLSEYCSRLKLPSAAVEFLKGAAQAPSRGPNGYLSNTFRYPCPINGHTITAESGRYEFPFVLTITNRPDVLRVFEQGPLIVVRAKTDAGVPFTFPCTVDAVVCTETGVEIYEVMAASEVAHLCCKNPNRFQSIGAHKYGSKPVADYFGAWGFVHHIVTEYDLDPGYVQSADFLRPYRTGHAQPPLTQDEVDQVAADVARTPGIFLEDIAIEPPARRAEIVYHLLAKGEIFTHLSEGNLTRQAQLRLYPTAVQERAFELLRKTAHRRAKNLQELGYILRVGSLLEIEGREYVVESLGNSAVEISRTKDGGRQKVSFETLLDMKPLIGGILHAEKTFEAKLRDASPEAIMGMLHKHAVIQRCSVSDPSGVAPSSRTLRRWKAAMKTHAETSSAGSGVEALLHTPSGNCNSRIDPRVEQLLERLIERYYLRPEAETAQRISLRLVAINARFKLGATPTYRTIARHCAALDPYVKALRRGGKRYAERVKPIFPKNALLGNPNGARSWQYAHCDSTRCDLMSREGDEIEYLYLIKMVDSFDGRVLCHCVTEENPSEATVRQLLVACVERHRVLPATITFDWGPEGRSSWIQMTMEQQLGITLILRPKATPRSGSNIETLFRKLCVELLHNLQGSTKLLQKARMITRAVDPRDRAVWTAGAIRELLDEYYELVNDLPRRNRRPPNLVAQESIAKYGMPPTQIPEVEAFKLALLPFVEGITRVVSDRGVVRHAEHGYYHEDLRPYAGREVSVRFDVNDIQHVRVTLPDQGRRTLVCDVVDTALKYASPEDAQRIHAETARANAKDQAAVVARKAAFVLSVDRKQKALLAAARRKNKPDPGPPKAEPSGKIVPMPISFKQIIEG